MPTEGDKIDYRPKKALGLLLKNFFCLINIKINFYIGENSYFLVASVKSIDKTYKNEEKPNEIKLQIAFEVDGNQQ